MAEPARRLPDTRKPTPLRVVRGDDRDVSEEEILTLSSPPTHHRARPRARRLLLSERLLAEWLRVNLATIGGETMIRRYGARAVLLALRHVAEGRIVLAPEPPAA